LRSYHPLLVGAPIWSMPPTGVNMLVTFVSPMGAIRCLLLAWGMYEMRSFVLVYKVLSSHRHSVALLWCCYAQHEALEALERNFAPLFLLAPAAAASEPAPVQLAEVLRARKRRYSAALAEPIPGQLLLLRQLTEQGGGGGPFY
jgi:hypothetical protein